MPGEQGLEVRPSREYWPRERMALVLLRQGLDCHLEKTLVEQAEGFWEDLRVLRLLWGRTTAQSPILSLRGSTPDLPAPEKQLQRRSGPMSTGSQRQICQRSAKTTAVSEQTTHAHGSLQSSEEGRVRRRNTNIRGSEQGPLGKGKRLFSVMLL